MRIHRLLNAKGYQLCQPTDQDGWEMLADLVDGRPRGRAWPTIKMEIVKEDHNGKALKYSDAPWVGGHALVLRTHAVESMKDLLLPYGELLELSSDGEGLKLFHATRLLDCLDEARAKVDRFASGQIMRIRQFAFHESMVSGVDVFRPIAGRGVGMLVGGRFVDMWMQAKLEGLDFMEVWKSHAQ